MTEDQADPRGSRHGEALDIADLWRADLAAIEALARLQLRAGRRGVRLYLWGASPRLRELLVLTGLDAVLPCDPVAELPRTGGWRSGQLGVEAQWQAEERKEAGGVEEEGDSGDPVT